jgi:hypothetical protein
MKIAILFDEKTCTSIAELKCSAISSPIMPSVDTNIIPNANEHTNEFTYQPLLQRTSMGNIYSSSKSTSSVESGNRTPQDFSAPSQVVSLNGTKGLLFLLISIAVCACTCFMIHIT